MKKIETTRMEKIMTQILIKVIMKMTKIATRKTNLMAQLLTKMMRGMKSAERGIVRRTGMTSNAPN